LLAFRSVSDFRKRRISISFIPPTFPIFASNQSPVHAHHFPQLPRSLPLGLLRLVIVGVFPFVSFHFWKIVAESDPHATKRAIRSVLVLVGQELNLVKDGTSPFLLSNKLLLSPLQVQQN
jgi:hypothetical protein